MSTGHNLNMEISALENARIFKLDIYRTKNSWSSNSSSTSAVTKIGHLNRKYYEIEKQMYSENINKTTIFDHGGTFQNSQIHEKITLCLIFCIEHFRNVPFKFKKLKTNVF